jgi:hypothetical protein
MFYKEGLIFIDGFFLLKSKLFLVFIKHVQIKICHVI